MTIAINGYFLTRPFTGFGNYTVGLLGGLAKIDRTNRYLVFVPEKVAYKPTNKRIKIIVLPEKRWLPASAAKFVWEQRQLPQACGRQGVDLIHQFYPATAKFCSVPQIVSIHDATPWHFAEHNYSKKIRSYREFTRKTASRAAHVVTVSNFAAQDIAKIFGIAQNKITVIYNGIDPTFRHKVSAVAAANTLAKYHIKKPYIFYLGGYEVHKNVRRMFFAYAKVISEINGNLVLAGGVFSKTRPLVYKDWYELPKLIENYKLEKRVQLIGPVESEDLPALYQSAALFISPSIAEGFNIPVVEAFASRVPVVCSNTAGTKEIAQEAAYLFDPANQAAIERAMLKVLNDSELRRKLIESGWRRQQQFSWEKAARELVEVYYHTPIDKRIKK
ncbi:glycosyltransferase family 4 protein [Candidatus Berkelbacteria bacterium]|nr:glycosyltransferase family 4 protein [Candidatus Berkelbacteria bacterium]